MMSSPAKDILVELQDSLGDVFKENEKGADSLLKQFDDIQKYRDDVLNDSDINKGSNQKKAMIQDTLMVAFISLVAKMAKSDGRVIKEEVESFDQILINDFKYSVAERKIAAGIFNKAKNSSHGFQEFAKQIAQLSDHEMLLILYEKLIKISCANSTIPVKMEKFLLEVGNIFRLSQDEYDKIKNRNKAGKDPYKILGVTREMSLKEISRAYKKLLMKNHPDRLISKGLPDDFIKEVEEKVAEFNVAYDEIEKEKS
ncbi:MAG: hypothetical protein COA79_05325 [Planctomycetota bacterium]|nr:MAG: hypothetical protein COA79_05325 [Planctomycetota bacterium]